MNRIPDWLRSNASSLLSALPLITYWLFWFFNPSYWFSTDPTAWYFLDSLAIFTGSNYTYVDHPGAPMHLMGSFLLGLTYPFFSDHKTFILYHADERESFFRNHTSLQDKFIAQGAVNISNSRGVTRAKWYFTWPEKP